MTETVTGVVDGYNIDDDSRYYGIVINDQWFNGDFTVVDQDEVKDLNGERVKLEVDESDRFIDIENVKVLEDSRGLKSGSRVGEGASNAPLPKDKQIIVNTAFQKAVEAIDLSSFEKRGEYIEEVNKLTSGFVGVLEKQMDEVNQE